MLVPSTGIHLEFRSYSTSARRQIGSLTRNCLRSVSMLPRPKCTGDPSADVGAFASAPTQRSWWPMRFVVSDGGSDSSTATCSGDRIVLFPAASGGQPKTSEEEDDSTELIPTEFIPMRPEG